MGYRLKIGPSQGLKLKGQAGFSMPMLGGIGIKATKSGGIWTVDLDYSELTPGPVSDATTAYVAIEDKTAGIYREVSLASLLTSGLDADLQAIAALTSNGVLVRTADDTWALRTITGTANEITVTNGDGVSGNPTVSLPNALTFTDKTVTGGTFDGITITTSTFNGNTWTAGTGTLTLGAGKTATISNTMTFTGTDGSSAAFGAGGTVAYQGGTLAQFAATTSAQLKGVISDETGSGALVFATSPSLITPSFAQIVNTGTLTLPTATDTLVGRATTDTLTNKTLTSPAITTPTGIVKGDVGLGNVDNTSDATKNAATATLTNKTISGASNTISNIGNSSLTNSSVTIAGHSVALGGSQAIAIGDLSSISDGTIVGNISGSSAAPVASTITAVLDKLFGTTQGSVIYRGASTWGALTPGTSGNFLKTQGASANPIWDSIPGGGDMLSTNNLSDLASATTALTNLGGTTVGKSLFTATDAAAARTAAGVGTGAAATQSDQETATSTTVAVTPGCQQYHPSASKVWAFTTYSGGTPTLQASWNVTSITDSGVGQLTVTIATDFSSANYAVCSSAQNATTNDKTTAYGSLLAGSFAVTHFTTSGTLTDPTSISCSAYGDQ